jgi:hypothetical protein
MKRSEILKILADWIKDNDTSTCSTEQDRITMSSGLLLEIEKAGMLPPETIRYIDQDNGNTLVSSECLWEPEDE